MKYLRFIGKSIRFIFRYLFNDPLFVLWYGAAYKLNGYTNNAAFLTDEEFAKKIALGQSVIRIGDGEIGLLHGRGVSYQKVDPVLVQYLKKSIMEYSQASPYIIAIPTFVNYSNEDLRRIKVLNCWLPLKIEFKRIFNSEAVYGDAHFFYYKNNFENFLEKYLKQKKLIINTTKDNISTQKKVIEDTFSVLGWIESKSPDPFDLFEDTQSKINTLLEGYAGDKKDIVLLLGSGPMSKVLAYVYSKKGVQSLDIGKGFEHIYNNKNFQNLI